MAVDDCVGQVVGAVRANGYDVIIIADHGNADYAVNPDGSANTAHSLNPVPIYLVSDDYTKVESGILADVAPTVCRILGIDAPAENFLVRCEYYGIPQARSRVIILGFRNDIDISGFILPTMVPATPAEKVLRDLPELRSTLSKEEDSLKEWRSTFKEISGAGWLDEAGILHGNELKHEILLAAEQLYQGSPELSGKNYLPCRAGTMWNRAWYADKSLKGVLHHEARPHIRPDLHRYLFCSCFRQVKGRAPKLPDFPISLLPEHKNAQSGNFKDRFRVVSPDRPSHTVISHLGKDGHAFIHPDPLQCRSLTPREAARLQTFPDNYYFFGGRASQFRQIGNAVPPWLAHLIAESLVPIF